MESIACIAFQMRILRRYLSYLKVSEEIRHAIANNVPVVALESTIISHGMPFPRNIEMATKIEALIRSRGVIPATIGIIHGEAQVGLTYDDLLALADPERHQNAVMKASRRDISFALSQKKTAATTVAGTMIFAHQAGIDIFATGGIGGVHRGAEVTMDISADLVELGRTPVAVICAGVKSILDIPKTLEFLETQGVPVVGLNTPIFPAFFTNDSSVRSPLVCESTEAVARMIFASKALGLSNGMIIGVPNPHPADSASIQVAIEASLAEAEKLNISGHAITPFLLSDIQRRTGGMSLEANISLVLNNASIAADIAKNLASLRASRPTVVSSSIGTKSFPSTSMQVKSNVLIFGGAVLDQVARISDRLIPGSSNPGKLSLSVGGVGFNIARRLAEEGHDPSLVTAIAGDSHGQRILTHCESVGIDMKHSLTSQAGPDAGGSATYTAVHGPDGELVIAVADMNIFTSIEPLHVQNIASYIRTSGAIICDGNISKEAFASVAQVCESYDKSLFFEPTSDHKCTLPIDARVIDKVSYSPQAEVCIHIMDAID